MTTLNILGSRGPFLLESILWIEADQNYAWIHFSDQPKLLVARPLRWFERQLPSFIRVHKSSLVNVAHLSRFNRINPREAEVILSNRVVLSVSRRRVQPIANFLQGYTTIIADTPLD